MKHDRDMLSLVRSSSSHKGQNGKVLIVGGSLEYVGAPVLAGLAALRAGADIVNIVAPQTLALLMNSFSPDLITTKLPGDFLQRRHFRQIRNLSLDYDVVLIGNGLVNIAVQDLITSLEVPVVVDAGGLHKLNVRKLHNCILTPHHTEFLSLLKSSQLTNETLRTHLGSNIILKKGPMDVVMSNSRTEHVKGGNAGMTVGGTGDVLAGVVASLLAQSGEAWQSAMTASFAVKKAGNLCRADKGYQFIASDVIEKLPEVLRSLER